MAPMIALKRGYRQVVVDCLFRQTPLRFKRIESVLLRGLSLQYGAIDGSCLYQRQFGSKFKMVC